MSRQQREITVLGAGIIGMACAINLQRLGFNVTVVDQNDPGDGCSSGNTGIIAPSAMVPVNAPGLIKKIPAMLLDPLGPIAFRWKHIPQMLPWIFNFLKNGRASNVERIVDGLSALTSNALKEHQDLAGNGEASRWFRPSPYLYVYESEAVLAEEDYYWKLRRIHGISTRVLKGREVQEFEPALDPRFKCAVVMENGHGFSTDPSQMVKALAFQFQSNGGKVIQSEVLQIKILNQKPSSLITNAGSIPLQRLVIAAGAFSAKFATQLGERIPLEAERGYHIMLKNPGIAPRYPIMNSSGKFVTTPMESGLRIGGLVEFGGLVANPNYKFASRLITHAKSMFPLIKINDFTEWMGHRPALPDSLPVIGQSTKFENIFYALGHHHIGLTTGPRTGRAVAELIAGQTPCIDLSPYSIRRFNRK
jgi:D-amino-acid dehydrogenase|tara:strand:- start:1081 stop:2340 length:1260 start_codon:yes stop_codon:yes gene_type:complete